MHLADEEPTAFMNKLKSQTTTKDSFGTAIKKKLRSAAGAPGRALYNAVKKPHDDYKMAKADKDFAFLKDYNAKDKAGVPISNKERAQFQMYKDRK
jgi:hypothetical protein